MAVNSARELFEHGLGATYYAEHELLDVLDERLERPVETEVRFALVQTAGERVPRAMPRCGRPGACEAASDA